MGAPRHVAQNRFSDTPAGPGTECPLPSAAQHKAVARLLDDIRPDWGSVLLRSRVNHNMEEVQAPENATRDLLASGLPPNGLQKPLRAQLVLTVEVLLPENLWPPAPPKAEEGTGMSKPTANQFSVASWESKRKTLSCPTVCRFGAWS